MNNNPSFPHDDNILARFFGRSSNYTDIPNQLFKEHNVKKGLRNEDGTGVRVGLTKVCDVIGYTKDEEGNVIPCEGDLIYRGYSIRELLKNRQHNCGYEETVFLLLFGYLPDRTEFANFRKSLSDRYDLPADFLTNDILRNPSRNLMNKLQSCTISLYNYAPDPDAQDTYQTLLKGLDLVAKFPSIGCYSYFAKMHHFYRQSLIIHYPRPEYSIAENILYMLRTDGKFTDQEASVLDALLLIHAEHGGGNNSAFACRVLTSSGTDPYSAYAAAIGALKGFRHGGANIKVVEQLDNFKAKIKNPENDGEVADFIRKVLRKEEGDGAGLIYGMGHAVYTLSDPRAVLLKERGFALAKGKDIEADFRLLDTIERLTPALVAEKSARAAQKHVCANVDLYSGLVYRMLGIPAELLTPMFAVSRIAGWSAHRIEEVLTGGRIIRPAYKSVAKAVPYVPLAERE